MLPYTSAGVTGSDDDDDDDDDDVCIMISDSAAASPLKNLCSVTGPAPWRTEATASRQVTGTPSVSSTLSSSWPLLACLLALVSSMPSRYRNLIVCFSLTTPMIFHGIVQYHANDLYCPYYSLQMEHSRGEWCLLKKMSTSKTCF